MSESKRTRIARDSYLAYATDDHDFFDENLSDGIARTDVYFGW